MFNKFILAALLLIPSLAYSDGWSKSDTYREAAFLTVHAMDWIQTRDIHNHPNLQESNPLLGAHPHKDKIDTLFIASSLAHIYASKTLQKRYRNIFQYITIGIKAGVVAHNYKIGINVKF